MLDLSGDASQDIVDRRHRGQHRVILIVVLVHAVAADQEKIVETVQILPDLIEPAIAPK